jgi:hypothetical protein
VQHVEPEERRDLEPGLARQGLGAGHVLGAVEVQQGPGLAFRDVLPVERRAMGDEVQLSDLLLQGHLRQEVVHPALDPLLRPKRRRGQEESRDDAKARQTRNTRKLHDHFPHVDE